MTEKHELMGGKLHRLSPGKQRLLAMLNLYGGKELACLHERGEPCPCERLRPGLVSWNSWAKAVQACLRSARRSSRPPNCSLHEYEIITAGERNPQYVESFRDRLRVHLLPFFGNKLVSEITPGLVQEYRIHRTTSRLDKKTGEPMRPARSTIHHGDRHIAPSA